MTRSEAIARKRKVRKRRRRAIRRAVCMAGLMAVIVTALRTANKYLLTADSITKPENSRSKTVYRKV